MNYKHLLHLTENFYRIAAVQSVMKLKEHMGQQFQNANLWLTERPAFSQEDPRFAIFDKENLEKIKEIIGISDHELIKFYLEHEKIQELINFIITSYNRHFPDLDGNKVLEFLKRSGNLDEYHPISNRPIFDLMHDLIHQIIEHNFIESLEGQEIIEGNKTFDDVTTLLDEIYEDLASTLSNLSPIGFTGQGLVKYIRKLFYKYLGKKEINEKNLKETIEKVFYQAKAELRGKIDSPTIRRRMGKHLLKKYRNMEQASGRIKQFADTQLSKYKKHLLDLIPEIIEASKDTDNYRIDYSNVFKFIEQESFHFLDEYSDSINNADLLDPVESSAMRGWILECLREMKKVSNYFKYELYEDFYGISEYEENDE